MKYFKVDSEISKRVASLISYADELGLVIEGTDVLVYFGDKVAVLRDSEAENMDCNHFDSSMEYRLRVVE